MSLQPTCDLERGQTGSEFHGSQRSLGGPLGDSPQGRDAADGLSGGKDAFPHPARRSRGDLALQQVSALTPQLAGECLCGNTE